MSRRAVLDPAVITIPDTVRVGWCFPCLDGNHDGCIAMADLPMTGHLCECPWVPWSAEVTVRR